MKIFGFSIIFALFALTFCVSAQTYDRARLWDAEINSLTGIDLEQTPPQSAVLFVGSSSIQRRVNLRSSFPNLNVINRGFGDSRIEDVNFYFDRIVAPYNPKSKLIYIGLKPSPLRWKRAENFRQTNYLIKAEIVKDKRAVFVDFWSPMPDGKGEPKADIFLEDNLHMSEKGYAIWRDVLAKYLK